MCWTCFLGCWRQGTAAGAGLDPPGNRSGRPWPGAARRWSGGCGAVRSPLVADSPSWACCLSEQLWQCAQLPNGQETRNRAWPRPPGLGDALGPCVQRFAGLLASAGPPGGGSPAGTIPHCHWAVAAEHWLVGATRAAALWSTGAAGGASALAAVPQPSGLLDTAESAAIKSPAGFHRNMAGLQTF